MAIYCQRSALLISVAALFNESDAVVSTSPQLDNGGRDDVVKQDISLCRVVSFGTSGG